MKKRAKKKVDVLAALLQAVSARYEDAGDKTKAGVQFSCLVVNPAAQVWYGAVHRYPTGPDDKRIVLNIRESGTLEQCIMHLAGAWYRREQIDSSVTLTQRQLRTSLAPLHAEQVVLLRKLKREAKTARRRGR